MKRKQKTLREEIEEMFEEDRQRYHRQMFADDETTAMRPSQWDDEATEFQEKAIREMEDSQ